MDKEKEPAAKRAQVANACLTCRTAKLKCSGEHPKCSRCIDRGLVCKYDTTEGRTKRQQLRHDLHDRQEELERAMVVLSHLQHGSDHEAANSLAHLRMGSSIETEFTRIQANGWSSPQTPGRMQHVQLSTTGGESSASREHAMQHQHIMTLLGTGAQQSGAHPSWSRPSGSGAEYTATAGADQQAQNWDNIDPQMLEDSNATSRAPSRPPFR